MSNSIISSTTNCRERTRALLFKEMPMYRKAYSDRTSWLMACMSDLAYLKFNPPVPDASQVTKLIALADKHVSPGGRAVLVSLINNLTYNHEEEKQLLESDVRSLNLQLIDTFDEGGTQAILLSSDEFIVLAFRGTEATSIRDIRSDLKAKTTECETGGKIHTGFKEAFEKVEVKIQDRLNADDVKTKPLFITGHSLGGALATIAAKKLDHEAGIAACYTFGSPRVGDDQWIANLKTPVYRVVNAADGVPVVPLGPNVMAVICSVVKRVPYVGESARAMLARYRGYIHCGDMRYLTNCKSGEYDKVRLLFYVNFLFRMKGFFVGNFRFNKFVKDHSISVYRQKLMIVAEKRNEQ